MDNVKKILTLIIALASGLWTMAQDDGDKNPVVIVTSYSPDVRNVSDNIQAFSQKMTESGMNVSVIVENLNTQDLDECLEWKDKLWDMLSQYYVDGNAPTAIVLLGNEASSAYLSLDRLELRRTPVLIGMRGDDIIKLPNDTTIDLSTWMPHTLDLTSDFPDYNIVGGTIYDYDVKRSIDLINFFYPDCRSLVLLTDNSFGGLTMKAMFYDAMKDFPEYSVESIDGRQLSFMEVNDRLASVAKGKVLITGTWRMDKSNQYVVKNTTHTLAFSNERLPAFTIAYIGLGHWCIGGYMPQYHVIGGEMADDLIKYLKTGRANGLHLCPNEYIFDNNKLEEKFLTLDGFEHDYELLNKPESVWDEHGDVIVTVITIIIVLTLCLFVSLHYLRKSRRLSEELRQHSVQLEKAKKKAEEASVMKSNFIANMSHEIRTPMNAVVGFSQLLSSDDMGLSKEEKMEFGQLIKMNSELLLSLVNDILDISKFDAGRITFSMRDIDIVSLCRMAGESAMSDLKEGVKIKVVSSKDKYIIHTDRDRVLQVLSNLINNAKKCTDEGTITITVGDAFIDRETHRDMLWISVTDTGCGIPKDKVEVVFERFVKLSEFRQGTGLGLSVCRSIVENLGGKIWVDTEYTGGARFVFTHPVDNVEHKLPVV